MSQRVWISCVMTAALLLAAFAALYQIRTYDTLFHLAAGRYIVEHGELPARDPFSFTFRGAAWVNHSGAFQVLLAGLYAVGGFGLLSVYQALLATMLCGLALFALRGRSHVECAVGAVLAVLPYCAFREVLEARPHVVGFVCLAGLVLLVLHANRAGRARVVWFALPLYAAWAGSHGSHVLAYVVLGFAALDALVGKSRALLATYCAVIAGCLAIMALVAPWAFQQGLEHAGSLFLESAVSEWRPLTAADILGSWPGRTFALLWLATIAGAVRVVVSARHVEPRPPEARLGALLLLLFMLALACSSRRMIALFTFGAAPLWLPYAVQVLPRVLTRPRWIGAAGGAAMLVLFAITSAQGETFRTGVGLARERFPIDAVAAIRGSGRVQRIYNAYNFGGYLMFAGVPAEGVFVDGRAITLYPPEFLAEFSAAYRDPQRFERLAEQFRCDSVLLPVASAPAAGLRAHLRSSSSWRLTHRDSVAELYERASPLTASAPRAPSEPAAQAR